MKLFLFLVMFAFSAHAGSIPCVEDNRNSCDALGYTIEGNTQEAACPYGGVACPFDSKLWNCAKWTCADGNLFEVSQAGMNCRATTFKGKHCYKCECQKGSANYDDCLNKTKNLAENKDMCGALGYKDSVTDCGNYLACPYDANKVNCLDSFGGCQETVCIQEIVIPEDATPIYETKTCTCGEQKSIVVGFNCKDGFEKDGERCVAKYTCNEGESEDAFDTECYQEGKLGAGWSKGSGRLLGDNTYSKQCYECRCTRPENCQEYTDEQKGAFGVLKELCCDGISYQRCVAKCPTGTHIPSFAEPSETENCEACGQTFAVSVAWKCQNGYTINEQGTGCDPLPCNKENTENTYYGLYSSEDDCATIVQARSSDGSGLVNSQGWQFMQDTQVQSGEGKCSACQCTATDDLYSYEKPVKNYTYTDSDGYKADLALYSGFGCNRRYRSCTISQEGVELLNLVKIDQYNSAHVKTSNEYDLCGEKYFSISSCDLGYELKNKACKEVVCDAKYALNACPEDENGTKIATCSTCQQGEQLLYAVEKCEEIMVGGRYINYVKKDDTCCRQTCYTENYKPLSQCANGLDEYYETETNGCGELCGRCK